MENIMIEKKRKQKPEAVLLTLGYYIARLAEEIALNENSSQCDMCVIGNCGSQVSGMTCLNGISAWLWQQAEAFTDDSSERECAYFSFLESLSASQLENVNRLMDNRFPHFKLSVCGAQPIIDEWRARKGRYLP